MVLAPARLVVQPPTYTNLDSTMNVLSCASGDEAASACVCCHSCVLVNSPRQLRPALIVHVRACNGINVLHMHKLGGRGVVACSSVHVYMWHAVLGYVCSVHVLCLQEMYCRTENACRPSAHTTCICVTSACTCAYLSILVAAHTNS